MPAAQTLSRQISKSSALTSAIPRRTSFRARSGSSSISASTTHGRPRRSSAEIARRVGAAAGDARFTLTFDPTNAVAFLTKRGPFTDLVAAAVEDVTGRRPRLSTGGGTSDARFIKTVCPVVELGLVNATIHAVDERVPLADLEGLTRIYERVLERYFSASGP